MKAQWEKLPNEIRAAILATDLQEKLRAMARSRSLRVDEAGIVENETMLVLLGLEHPNDYVSNLERELHVSRDVAETIAKDVNENVFMPVHDAIIALHKKDAVPATDTPSPRAETPTKTLEAGIAATKLGGTTHLAPDTLRMTEPAATPKASPIVQSGTYTKGTDPYREPVL